MGMCKRSFKGIAAGLAALAAVGMMTGCGMSSGGDSKASSGSGQKVELKLAYQLPSEHHLSKSLENLQSRSMKSPRAPSISRYIRQDSCTMTRISTMRS